MKQARDTALRFDAAPSYSMKGLQFYEGPDAMAYDDFGDTALGGLEAAIAGSNPGLHLRSNWDALNQEEPL